MTIYKIHTLEGVCYIHRIMDGCVAGWFNRYDFMGSVIWGSFPTIGLEQNEAEQIVKDLEAADM